MLDTAEAIKISNKWRNANDKDLEAIFHLQFTVMVKGQATRSSIHSSIEGIASIILVAIVSI